VSSRLRAGVLFDVDGTLADTDYLHTLAWSRALRDAGEWAPMNAIHRLIGMGGDQLVPRLLGYPSPAANAARARRYQELKGDVRAFPWPTPHPNARRRGDARPRH
jgi:phosphoglycolate phosphatase-like HAD superfamily hydrolase